MRNLLTIGELASLLGISTSKIRFYEKKGLLKPSDITEHGYRLYDFQDYDRIESIITYRELGLSIEVIKEYYTNYSYESNMKLLDLAKKQVEEQRETLDRIERKITSRMSKFESFEVKEPTYSIVKYPERHILIYCESSFEGFPIKKSLDLADQIECSFDDLIAKTYIFTRKEGIQFLGVEKGLIGDKVKGLREVVLPEGEYLEVWFMLNLQDHDAEQKITRRILNYAEQCGYIIDDLGVMIEDEKNSLYALNYLAMKCQLLKLG